MGCEGAYSEMKPGFMLFIPTVLPRDCSVSDAAFVDGSCNWSSAKHWAQWRARCDHLKMLSQLFPIMEDKIWKQCPTSYHKIIRIVKVMCHNP